MASTSCLEMYNRLWSMIRRTYAALQPSLIGKCYKKLFKFFPLVSKLVEFCNCLRCADFRLEFGDSVR